MAAVASGLVLTVDGLVVGTHADAVLVAVPDDEVAGVATAAADGTLTLVLRPAVSASRPR